MPTPAPRPDPVHLDPVDLLLLSSGGALLAQYSGVDLADPTPQGLTAAAERVSGQRLWLLHDGGVALGRRGGPARFEVLSGVAGSGPAAPPLPNARPWQCPGWRGEVRTWIEAQLAEPVGRLEWVHSTDVGAVLRVRTRRLTAYLKVGEDGREATTAAQLQAQLPGLTPDLLAADPDRGWLLTRDAGTSLLDSADLATWLETVQTLAGVHRSAHLSGVPVHAFQDLPARLTSLLAPAALRHWDLPDATGEELRTLLPAILDIHRRVTALGLPECVCHGDLHPNNVLVGNTGVRFFDWSEAGVAHPFTDLGWLLAFIMHPARAALPLRQQCPDLGEQLWAAYRTAADLHTDLRWQEVALLALVHRAVVYDATYRDWVGTVPGFRPGYTPYALRTARLYVPPAPEERALSCST